MSIAFLMFLLQEKSKVSVHYLFVKIARNCTYYTHVCAKIAESSRRITLSSAVKLLNDSRRRIEMYNRHWIAASTGNPFSSPGVDLELHWPARPDQRLQRSMSAEETCVCCGPFVASTSDYYSCRQGYHVIGGECGTMHMTNRRCFNCSTFTSVSKRRNLRVGIKRHANTCSASQKYIFSSSSGATAKPEWSSFVSIDTNKCFLIRNIEYISFSTTPCHSKACDCFLSKSFSSSDLGVWFRRQMSLKGGRDSRTHFVFTRTK